jgi:aspartyl-tRNA(Asn)/glutamyl-tRNA(Gln) amidotransferase subunit B
MSKYIPTIGLEIHVQLKTNTKLFSSSRNCSFNEPNINVCEYDIGTVGTMPMPNENAVIKAIQLATALNMQIDSTLRFDRKNYFYSDLPKGYQITQQFHPIAKNGKINLTSGKQIEIERFHLEEDTAKQIVENGIIKIDYNRCGIPLIEIVSKPQIANGSEALEYLSEIKKNLTFLEISDGKLEEGSMRVDVNISISKDTTLGNKVEIKNLNSFSNVAKAIDFEIKRQEAILEKNEIINSETRRWDETLNETVFMRAKNDLYDYRYIPETTILPINIEELIKTTQKSMPKTPETITQELTSSNISNNFIKLLLNDYELYKKFVFVNNKVNDVKLTTT